MHFHCVAEFISKVCKYCTHVLSLEYSSFHNANEPTIQHKIKIFSTTILYSLANIIIQLIGIRSGTYRTFPVLGICSIMLPEGCFIFGGFGVPLFKGGTGKV